MEHRSYLSAWIAIWSLHLHIGFRLEGGWGGGRILQKGFAYYTRWFTFRNSITLPTVGQMINCSFEARKLLPFLAYYGVYIICSMLSKCHCLYVYVDTERGSSIVENPFIYFFICAECFIVFIITHVFVFFFLPFFQQNTSTFLSETWALKSKRTPFVMHLQHLEKFRKCSVFSWSESTIFYTHTQHSITLSKFSRYL